MESICNTPIRRIVSRTSSFVARFETVPNPCAASTNSRAVSIENLTRLPPADLQAFQLIVFALGQSHMAECSTRDRSIPLRIALVIRQVMRRNESQCNWSLLGSLSY